MMFQQDFPTVCVRLIKTIKWTDIKKHATCDQVDAMMMPRKYTLQFLTTYTNSERQRVDTFRYRISLLIANVSSCISRVNMRIIRGVIQFMDYYQGYVHCQGCFFPLFYVSYE